MTGREYTAEEFAVLYKQGRRYIGSKPILDLLRNELAGYIEYLAGEIVGPSGEYASITTEKTEAAPWQEPDEGQTFHEKWGIEERAGFSDIDATATAALVEALATYDPEGRAQFSSWAYTVIRWRLLDLKRELEGQPVRSSDVSLTTEHERIPKVAPWLATEAIDSLDPGEKDLIAARLSAAYPTAQALADHLGVHRNTINNRRKRIEAKLGDNYRAVTISPRAQAEGWRYFYRPGVEEPPGPFRARRSKSRTPWRGLEGDGKPEDYPETSPVQVNHPVTVERWKHELHGRLWRSLVQAYADKVEASRVYVMPPQEEFNGVMLALWLDSPAREEDYPSRKMAWENLEAWYKAPDSLPGLYADLCSICGNQGKCHPEGLGGHFLPLVCFTRNPDIPSFEPMPAPSPERGNLEEYARRCPSCGNRSCRWFNNPPGLYGECEDYSRLVWEDDPGRERRRREKQHKSELRDAQSERIRTGKVERLFWDGHAWTKAVIVHNFV